jgi:paraquat-inducible protein A
VGCHICGALNEQDAHSCVRCGDHLHSRKPGGLNRTWALLVTSVILYIPPTFIPSWTPSSWGMTALDHHGGVVLLWAMGSYPIAAVIFFASVVVPLVKILALLWLCYVVQRGQGISSASSNSIA